MTGCIVQVWFEPEQEKQARPSRFAMIETELPDLATFCEMVDADQLIGGAILWTRKQGDGTNLISRRVPTAFRGSAVLRCQLPTWRFIDGGANF